MNTKCVLNKFSSCRHVSTRVNNNKINTVSTFVNKYISCGSKKLYSYKVQSYLIKNHLKDPLKNTANLLLVLFMKYKIQLGVTKMGLAGYLSDTPPMYKNYRHVSVLKI